MWWSSVDRTGRPGEAETDIPRKKHSRTGTAKSHGDFEILRIVNAKQQGVPYWHALFAEEASPFVPYG